MIGPGYWLNPSNHTWVPVIRHELAMRDAALMRRLDVDEHVIAAAQKVSPYGDGVDELRILGIRSRLIRVRDQGNYIAVQFDAPTTAETILLRFVHDFFEATELWRPFVRVGNLRTNSETTYSWQEWLARLAEPLQSATTDFPVP
jgi:hypothetical protein